MCSITRTISAALTLGLVASSDVAAQGAGSWFNRDRRFSFFDENDALGGKSDSSYTQGLRIRWDFAAWPSSHRFRKAFEYLSLACLLPTDTLPLATGEVRDDDEPGAPKGRCARKLPVNPCPPQHGRADRPCGLVAFGIGQTEYTPSNLLRVDIDPTTRPYAGYLFTSFGGTVLLPRRSVTSELTLGVLGPASAARGTQSLAHWTWASGSTEPRGWHNQLRNSLHVSLRNAYAFRLVEVCRKECDGHLEEGRIFDIVPTAEFIVGTLMNRASIGGSINLGYRYPDLATPFRIPATRAPADTGRPKTHFKRDVAGLWDTVKRTGWILGFVAFDQRFVAQNALLSGSYADRGPGEWRSRKAIELEHLVCESSFGGVGGVGRIHFGWQKVRRSAEYSPRGAAHRFGVVTLGIFSPLRAAND